MKKEENFDPNVIDDSEFEEGTEVSLEGTKPLARRNSISLFSQK